MKLVAMKTINAMKVTRARDRRVKGDRGETEKVMIKPGEDFDTAELGIDDKEAMALIAGKHAVRKMREVTDAEFKLDQQD